MKCWIPLALCSNVSKVATTCRTLFWRRDPRFPRGETLSLFLSYKFLLKPRLIARRPFTFNWRRDPGVKSDPFGTRTFHEAFFFFISMAGNSLPAPLVLVFTC